MEDTQQKIDKLMDDLKVFKDCDTIQFMEVFGSKFDPK